MKTLNAVVKVLAALATIAGAIYIVATYGEQIVAWARKMLNALPKCEPEIVADEADVAPAEEVAAEEAPAEEVAEEVAAPVEEPAPEVVVADNEPVAEEDDFAE